MEQDFHGAIMLETLFVSTRKFKWKLCLTFEFVWVFIQ